MRSTLLNKSKINITSEWKFATFCRTYLASIFMMRSCCYVNHHFHSRLSMATVDLFNTVMKPGGKGLAEQHETKML